VQGERNVKEKLAFPFISEPQPDLGGAKEAQGESKDEKNAVFISFSEPQPDFPPAPVAISPRSALFVGRLFVYSAVFP